MKKDWLSVIIPAYNTGKWVRGQLNQLKAQMSEKWLRMICGDPNAPIELKVTGRIADGGTA